MSINSYILKKRSSIHGYGIFAKKLILKGTRIIEYVGEKITKAEADRRGPLLVEYAKKHKESGSVYLFELNKKYDIDGHVEYNTAKYINHSCTPNCEVEIIRGHIWVIALRDIEKGEELFYNYGYDVENYEEHRCLCKSDCCPGYITAQEHWPKLKKLLTRNLQ
ncbi:MAG: SET domain-containing protein-lysine N-methyltransferase [Candidatus Omnitrophica bacterium]|nr:SET domain-containing protein-lysine N-methyltransferase [Candidatus Omnitrophota bacterium]